MENEDDLDLFSCALCGIGVNDSSNLTENALQTNTNVKCGHQFCMSCVERELSRKKAFSCPICGVDVKRVTLSTRSLDSVITEKDTNWRRRILKVYNKVDSDFPSLLEYNNYLEEVEDIIYSIVNEEPNAEECKARVKMYEEENKNQIVKRQSRQADLDRSIADAIATEKHNAERRKREVMEAKKAYAENKRLYKQQATQVSLGERQEVSQEVVAAQMQGYKNELLKAQRGRVGKHGFEKPLVREPQGGLYPVKRMDREFYHKRQGAGAGVPTGSIQYQERNWQLAISSLFSSQIHDSPMDETP